MAVSRYADHSRRASCKSGPTHESAAAASFPAFNFPASTRCGNSSCLGVASVSHSVTARWLSTSFLQEAEIFRASRVRGSGSLQCTFHMLKQTAVDAQINAAAFLRIETRQPNSKHVAVRTRQPSELHRLLHCLNGRVEVVPPVVHISTLSVLLAEYANVCINWIAIKRQRLDRVSTDPHDQFPSGPFLRGGVEVFALN